MFSTGKTIDYSESLKRDLTIDYREDDVYNSLPDKVKNRSDSVNIIANRLVKIYQAPSSLSFFRKCAWHLSEADICKLVESSRSTKVRQPLYFFISVAKRKMSA